MANKKSIINVKNDNDNECFKWAEISAVYPARVHPERLNKEMRANSEKFDWTGIEFPTPLKQIDRFEKNNPGYVVNVLAYHDECKVEERHPYPLRLTKKDGPRVINLLYISNEETNHYC